MMRMGPNANSKEWAKLLHEYMSVDGSFLSANIGKGDQISIMRALPHEDAVKPEEYVEVLDYEKASSLIAGADKFSIGLCSCRHEKMHLGEKKCDVPLESCAQFGYAADFMIRNNLAREVSRSEMEDSFARSKEMGLVMAADNVQKNMRFVCHCCGCCCNALAGLKEGGVFILQSDQTTPEKIWQEIPPAFQKIILDKKIQVFALDAFKIARDEASDPELQLRMQGIAFQGAFFAASPLRERPDRPE